ncbi:MAG TPA: HPP family protein [Acidimicrobiales bacterium]|nr:HPP family protein [Acidimicrobiales bacterium]
MARDEPSGAVELAARLRLTWLVERYPPRLVMGAFAFLNGLLTIGILASLAMVTDTPSLFPSLGPTAFLLFSTPMLASACPRNTVEGHLIGVVAGYLSLVLFGLSDNPATIIEGVTAGRVGAAALSLALTSGFMIWLQRAHPPAGATTLIISLGILHEVWQLGVLMVAVVLMVVQAFAINRLAGLDYPRWAPAVVPDTGGSRS